MNTHYYQSQINAKLQELIKAHNLTCEELTRDQFAEALRQAIAAGDFQRHVQLLPQTTRDFFEAIEHDPSPLREIARRQQVVYIPYAEVESLRSQLAQARETIAALTPKPALDSDQGVGEGGCADS